MDGVLVPINMGKPDEAATASPQLEKKLSTTAAPHLEKKLSTTAAPHLEKKLSILGMSALDFEHIKATHGHADHSFEVLPLLKVVRSIINSSTQVVDSIVKGNQVLDHESLEKDKPFKSPNINLPFCTLKAISSKLSTWSCKLACGEVNNSEDVAHDSTLKILKKLSNYSWDAKAVLTLAAFALDYGEFWHLALPHDKWDHLLKPLAILKGVDVLLKRPEYPLPKRRRQVTIGDLKDLIKKTLDVIHHIYELEKLSVEHNKEVPELAKAILEYIPVAVYWAIRTTLACITIITIFLTKDHADKSSGDLDRLISSVQMINNVFNDLNNYYINGKKQIELIKTQNLLRNLFNPNRFRIDEVFNIMIFGKNDPTVNVDKLKGKNVVWFISNVDISEEYIYKVIIPNDETIIEQYRIVWIPIVNDWTIDAKKKFKQLANIKSWLAVEQYSTIAGIRFIRDDWQYKDNPTVVVTSPKGREEYRNNSVHDDFFIWEFIIKLGPKWFEPLAMYINIHMSTWMEEKKYIFFYGGKDDKWVEQFKEKVETFTKEAKNDNIKLVCLGSSKSPEQFWSSVEKLFLSVINIDDINNKHQQDVDQLVTREVKKLFWFKNIESGWAMLFEGYTVATSGHGSTMMKVFEDFNEKLKEQVGPNFGSAFHGYHNQVLDRFHHCYRIDIKDGTEKSIPSHNVQCPVCSRFLGTYLSLQCCHEQV